MTIMLDVGLNHAGILVRCFVTGVHVTIDPRQSGPFPNWVIVRWLSTVLLR